MSISGKKPNNSTLIAWNCVLLCYILPGYWIRGACL